MARMILLPRMKTLLLATIVLAVTVYVSDVEGIKELLKKVENTLDELDDLTMFRRFMKKHEAKYLLEKRQKEIKQELERLPMYGELSTEESYATEIEDLEDMLAGNTDNEGEHSIGREKRTVRYWDQYSWGYDIPYNIDSSFSSQNGGYYVPILRRVLKWISQRICVTFHDVTAEVSNGVSMLSLGYPHEAYLNVNHDGSCSAYLSVNKITGPVSIKPCLGFQIELHEFLHSLGAPHMQQMPGRENFMSINPGNIPSDKLGTYSENSADDYYALYFDSTSTMLYGTSTFDLNGLETYYFTRDEDEMETAYGISREEIIFRELNDIYQCNAVFCGNQTVDCGPGYFTLREGVCRCVCPHPYDPDTNCQTLINGANNAEWPDVPMVIFKGGANTPCPAGFDESGEFSHEGIWLDKQFPLPDTFAVDSSTKTTYFQTCAKSASTPVDWEKMPYGGSYCLIKPVGVPCGFGQAATLDFVSMSPIVYSGNIGDTVISGSNITTKYCCSYQAHVDMMLRFPNGVPFRLIAKGDCPNVEGMRSYKGIVDYFIAQKTVTGGVMPQYYIFDNELQTFHCLYQVPVYGCSQEITLDATTSIVTITSPGYDQSAREPDRRCFYLFHAPAGAQLTLKVIDFDLDDDDQLLIQTYNVWQEQKKVDNKKPIYQMTSWENFLSVEFWAGWTTVTNKGVKFSVQVHLAEDSCYDVSRNGADYFGEKSIAEGDMECIPWSQAVTCDMFPWTYDMFLDIIDGNNYCRNPNGELHGPWCYTFVKGPDCQRKFCDACNYWEPHDQLASSLCTQLMADDPDFCNSASQRFGCSESCNFPQPNYVPSTCGTPTVPPGGTPLETLKSSYMEGEVVTFQCSGTSTPLTDSITCRKDGWTTLNYLCDACPADWVPYKDVCFKFMFHEELWGDDAEAACNALSSTGTLFRVTSAEDQTMLEEFRAEMGSYYRYTAWISGKLKNKIPGQAIGNWAFSGNDNVAMTYFNWGPNEDPNSMSKPCNRLEANYVANPDSWRAQPCDSSTYDSFYICQQDQMSVGCTDKDSVCESLLAKVPGFCSDAGSAELAENRCRRSCGYCQSNSCSEPISITYSRTSNESIIYPGEVMTFECGVGRYHVGGDLQRACGSSGQLLGEEPNCSLQPVTKDVNKDQLRKRSSDAWTKWAFLLDQDGYRVPFDGKITRWYYQCNTPNTVVYALVYRYDGTNYNYIGSNIINCIAQLPWSYNVPSADQISVQKDDIVGLYSQQSDTIYANYCEGEDELVLITAAEYATDINDLTSGDIRYQKCMVPSFGFQVTP